MMQYRAKLSGAVMVVIMMVVMAVRSAPVSLDPLLTRDGERHNPGLEHSSPERRGKIVAVPFGLNKREKIAKMLTSLEELNKSLNKTLSGRITFVPRANVRGPGKKNKAVMSEEAQRTSTAPPVDDGGTTSQPNDNLLDRNVVGGKGFKKSMSQPAKKPNKRVCFWKYCSQN